MHIETNKKPHLCPSKGTAQYYGASGTWWAGTAQVVLNEQVEPKPHNIPKKYRDIMDTLKHETI